MKDGKPDGSMLAPAIPFSVLLVPNMEALMAHKAPFPEIPPVPSLQRPGRAKAAGASRSRMVQLAQSQEPELPDLLEAFWGDGEATFGTANVPAPESTRRRAKRLNLNGQVVGSAGVP